MADRTLEQFPSAQGTLLRHREQEGRFVSFGPWESLEQVEAGRSSSAFVQGLRNMEDLLDAFEPGTFEMVRAAPADR